VTRQEVLVALLGTLGEIEALVGFGRERYDADRLLRLGVQRLWINAGNYAGEYRNDAGIRSGIEPWSGLYGYRSILAHQLPEDLSEDRVWHDTTASVATLRSQVQRLLEAH